MGRKLRDPIRGRGKPGTRFDLVSARLRARKVLAILEKAYPDARVALAYSNPLELLVATILSAQCTDVRVNLLTKALFAKYRSPADYANANPRELEQEIRPAGFYHSKAKSIQGCCRALLDRFHGDVPGTMAELTQLPGVGRKTANVILGAVFGVPGITVDTHVLRLSHRLGLARADDPVKVEFELMKLLATRSWIFFSNALIQHGRRVCKAIRPDCVGCGMNRFCPSAFCSSSPPPRGRATGRRRR